MILDGPLEELLEAVRDWPLATAPQLEKRLRNSVTWPVKCTGPGAGRSVRSEIQQATAPGMSVQEERDMLRQARAAGWVHLHQISGRIGKGGRYSLSDAGLDVLAASRGTPVPAYAAHYGISRTRHFRALMQAETTWWLYEVLGKLQDQGHRLHMRAHAPLVIPGRASGEGKGARFWPLALGVASLPSPTMRSGACRAIMVEWDTGDVLTTAYRSRFDTLYRWYQRLSGMRDLNRRFPVTVMLTTTGRRAAQLLLVWESCAYDRGVPILPLFIAPWKEVLASPSSWRRPEAPIDGGRLLTGVDGVPDPVSAMEIFGFRSLPHPASGATIETAEPTTAPGKGTQKRLLDGVLVSQTKPGGQHSRPPRRNIPRMTGLVQAQLNISIPGRRILERIAAWPLLSRREAVAVTGMKEALVRGELICLLNLGLIASFMAPDGRDLFHLTSLGISYLAATRGSTAAWYAAGRQWPVQRMAGSRDVELRLASLTVPYEHTRLTRWLFLTFLETARYYREERMLSHHLAVWEESEARRHFFFRGQQRMLAPDAAGVYLIGDQVYEFLVESDMGTRHTKSLVQKFTVFRDYRDSMAYHRDRVRFPLMLVVTSKGKDRVQELAAAIVEAGAVGAQDGEPVSTGGKANANEPHMTFLIASQADIQTHGLHRPVWLDTALRQAQDWATGQRGYCLAGFKDIPDSARMRLDLRTVRREVEEQLRYHRSL